MLINAKITGIFFSKEDDLKWRSILRAPSKRFSKFLDPMDKLIERPTELQRENRPPTQSFIEKTYSEFIPKPSISLVFVETAAK